MEAAKKTIKERMVQCYDCVKPFPRKEVRRLKSGDAMLCAECIYHRNRRKVRASIKLKKRNIE